ERPEEVVPTVRRALDTVANAVRLGAAASPDRVVPPAGVGDDGEEAPPQPRIEAVACRQEDRARELHRVRGVVPLGGVGGDVAEEVDGLPAFEVHDPQDVARPDDARPLAARGNGPLVVNMPGNAGTSHVAWGHGGALLSMASPQSSASRVAEAERRRPGRQ